MKSKTLIILKSWRGKYVGSHQCSECKCYSFATWRYRQSNIGEVYLCSECKPYVRDRSFGSIDAGMIALNGGAFESNRRKH